MSIKLGSSFSTLKLGSTTVTKAYLGSTQVYPNTGGVGSVVISNAGVIRLPQAGTGGCTQRSVSPTGGSGFTCNATFSQISGSTFFECTSVPSITNAGSGYSKNDVITLDITSVPDSREITYVELTVASLG